MCEGRDQDDCPIRARKDYTSLVWVVVPASAPKTWVPIHRTITDKNTHTGMVGMCATTTKRRWASKDEIYSQLFSVILRSNPTRYVWKTRTRKDPVDGAALHTLLQQAHRSTGHIMGQDTKSGGGVPFIPLNDFRTIPNEASVNAHKKVVAKGLSSSITCVTLQRLHGSIGNLAEAMNSIPTLIRVNCLGLAESRFKRIVMTPSFHLDDKIVNQVQQDILQDKYTCVGMRKFLLQATSAEKWTQYEPKTITHLGSDWTTANDSGSIH
ncbi:hypothetical protein C8J57DRAFT_1237740 [Mycena rebaudengoi]|nr:hypothetical protein C8J57DRAFT_1237740 [Mycena rebaudengoi]